MSADFQAFSSCTVLDNLHKRIEALEHFDGKVLAGLADGTLCVLEADQSSDSAPWQVVQAFKGFGKKHLVQLRVWTERSLLLSLDEEGVHAHKLPGFQLNCLANRTRNAHQFAWDAARARLAVAAKRRLLLFHYDGNEFAELKDVALPDSAVRLAWIGESVCVGMKREYILVHAGTGIVSELFKLAGEPCFASLEPGGGELLVARGNVGIFVGPDGRVSRKAGLTWSDAPAAVAYSQPYAAALLPNYVEIRSTQRVSAHGLAQILPLKGMTVAAPRAMPDGSVLVASEGGIQRLRQVPFRQQAGALADLGEFQEGLGLAQLMPDSEADERTAVQDELHTRYGYRLFAEGSFDDAMAHFGMCSNANPLVLLNIFPSLAPREVMLPFETAISGYKLPDMPEPRGEAYQQAVEVLLPYLLSHRSRLASFDAAEASSRIGGEGRQESEASTSGREAKGAAASGSSASNRQRHLMARAVDTAILKAMLATADSGALLRFVQRPNAADVGEGERALRAAGRYSELVALYQARGRHEDALDVLRRVSQRPHELSVSPRGAAAELRGVTGVWAAVKYLVTIGASHLDLVKRHARWILRADPEAGLEMFIQMEESLPPSAALPILTAQAPSLCAPFLESALASGAALAKEYHRDLASIYLRKLLSAEAGPSGRSEDSPRAENGGQPPSVLGPAASMQRLKELVLTSEFVDAHQLLLMLPSGKLPELRALLLERIGKHQEALRLYVHTMRNPELAEAYCDRMYSAAAKQAGGHSALTRYGDPSTYEMYLALIQVLLERRDERNRPGDVPDSQNWGEVARLLGRKHDRIEPMHALRLLPEEVPLKAVLPFLEGSLRSSSEQRRNAAVVRSLRRSENIGVREESVRCKQRSVIVSFERACGICHKRIGGSAFVAYPNGSLAHYSCYKRTRPTEITGDTEDAVRVYDISL